MEKYHEYFLHGDIEFNDEVDLGIPDPDHFILSSSDQHSLVLEQFANFEAVNVTFMSLLSHC